MVNIYYFNKFFKHIWRYPFPKFSLLRISPHFLPIMNLLKYIHDQNTSRKTKMYLPSNFACCIGEHFSAASSNNNLKFHYLHKGKYKCKGSPYSFTRTKTQIRKKKEKKGGGWERQCCQNTNKELVNAHAGVNGDSPAKIAFEFWQLIPNLTQPYHHH